jgi:hypothetical protein
MEKYKNSYSQFKKIKNKNERTNALKDLSNTLGKEVKHIKKEVRELRGNLSNLQINKKIMMIKNGKGSLGDISQEKALERCKL